MSNSIRTCQHEAALVPVPTNPHPTAADPMSSRVELTSRTVLTAPGGIEVIFPETAVLEVGEFHGLGIPSLVLRVESAIDLDGNFCGGEALHIIAQLAAQSPELREVLSRSTSGPEIRS